VRFRLLTYNIWKAGAGRVDTIAQVIAGCGADVALLQEATRPDIVAALADRTGMPVWRSFARQSLAYLSRGPVTHDEWHRPRFSRHAFIEVVPATVPVRLFGVHLSAVHAAWTERRRVRELGALLRTIGAHQHGFHLLAGDFNTLAPGAVLELNRLPPRLRPFVWLSGGRIKWRTIQTVIDAGYCDAFRILHADDPGMTMPAWDPHVRLDYVFVPQAFRDRLVSCDVVRDGVATKASDHLPVVADFTIPDLRD
jgi:endonuclease/exonuclease/phosphatase family metal-dependent hydrolase